MCTAAHDCTAWQAHYCPAVQPSCLLPEQLFCLCSFTASCVVPFHLCADLAAHKPVQIIGYRHAMYPATGLLCELPCPSAVFLLLCGAANYAGCCQYTRLRSGGSCWTPASIPGCCRATCQTASTAARYSTQSAAAAASRQVAPGRYQQQTPAANIGSSALAAAIGHSRHQCHRHLLTQECMETPVALVVTWHPP